MQCLVTLSLSQTQSFSLSPSLSLSRSEVEGIGNQMGNESVSNNVTKDDNIVYDLFSKT